jgi:MFS family permease
MGIITGLSLVLTGSTTTTWQLFTNYSLLLAAGNSAMYVIAMSTVSRWFYRQRGLALGIVGAGIGLGPAVMAPYATHLISTFDWRHACNVMGWITWAVVLPLSLLLKKDSLKAFNSSEKADATADSGGEVTPVGLLPRQALRTRDFWLFFSFWSCFSITLMMVITHFVPYLTDAGETPERAASLFSLMSGMSIAGAVAAGAIADRVGRKLTTIASTLVVASAMAWLGVVQDTWMFYVFVVVFGLSWGGINPGMAAMIGDSFGMSNIGVLFGLLDISWAMGSALGPAIGGLVYDISGSYLAAFILAAVMMVLAALLAVPIRRSKVA